MEWNIIQLTVKNLNFGLRLASDLRLWHLFHDLSNLSWQSPYVENGKITQNSSVVLRIKDVLFVDPLALSLEPSICSMGSCYINTEMSNIEAVRAAN